MSSWYFIETSNGLILTLKSDDEVVLSEREADDNKLWRLDEDGLLHSKTGLVVDIPRSNEDAGVRLIGYHDAHGGDNQRFTFERSTIRSELNSFVFDACGCPMVEKTSRSILSKSDRDTLMISCFRADGYTTQIMILWGDLLRSVPHIKTDVKINQLEYMDHSG